MVDGAYPIKRIRLINFHNFVDETIDLENGGHLFLLGDNGCGKTTILDAVHYVLTAGKDMEWNSAARLSGSKRDGRRIQGIVLRYNIDTGILNTGGAITYAALEIDGRLGRPLCIGVGLSAREMDQRIDFWGFIRECTLDVLPFTIEEEGNKRPCSKPEFKQRLESSHGYYTNKNAYRKDLSDRLFGGEDSYLDICRFLSMGKSYREISAGAADYHQLFKSLLPEPRSSIFEQIIEALRSLDESQALLEDLRRKLDWLKALHDKIQGIAEARQGVLRYEWLMHHFVLLQKQEEEADCNAALQKKKAQISSAQAELEGLEQQNAAIEERLNALLAKDRSGLVGQEKSCRAELERKRTELTRKQDEGQNLASALKDQEKELRKAQENVHKILRQLLPELARRGASLPFGITEFQAEIDSLHRTENVAEVSAPSVQQVIAQCDQHIHRLIAETTRVEQHLKGHDENLRLLEDETSRLQQRQDLVPQLPGYEQFEQALRNALLTPRPVFLGLEWALDLRQQQRDFVEESIGEEILATMLLHRGNYEKAREICTHYPNLHICQENPEMTDIPDWIRHSFDLKESDPDCLRVLALEMESTGLQPAVSMVAGKPVLAFRGHERTLTGASARLIGGESRKKALADEIRTLRKRMQELERERKTLQKNRDNLENDRRLLEEFKDYVNHKGDELREGITITRYRLRDTDSAGILVDKHNRDKQQLEQEIRLFDTRAAELMELIAKAGLANLEKRISRVKNERQALATDKSCLEKSIGGDQREVEQLEQRLESIGQFCRLRLAQKETLEQQIAPTLEPGTDPAHFILKTKKGQQFRSQEAIQKEINNCRVEVGTGTNEVKVQLNDPEFGGAFRFIYDEERNQLHDFRQQPITGILEQQSRNLMEQQEVISERTRELFKKIIMTDLMQYLRGHVGELETMVKKINNLLRNRTFGNQQYSFKIQPLDEFKRLISIIKKISPFDPSGEKELEHFFADHREAIITTETGSIPDELDYRNWYRYEMMVSTLGDEGKVIDRRNKSLGSGGEQAVPNYLLILTIGHFMYRGKKIRLHSLLFDEAFYGIDAGRRDQILGFATDLDLQLFIASPDQDGVRQEVRNSTTLLVKKDTNYDVHLYPFHWVNPINRQMSLLDPSPREQEITFGDEL